MSVDRRRMYEIIQLSVSRLDRYGAGISGCDSQKNIDIGDGKISIQFDTGAGQVITLNQRRNRIFGGCSSFFVILNFYK